MISVDFFYKWTIFTFTFDVCYPESRFRALLTSRMAGISQFWESFILVLYSQHIDEDQRIPEMKINPLFTMIFLYFTRQVSCFHTIQAFSKEFVLYTFYCTVTIKSKKLFKKFVKTFNFCQNLQKITLRA